MIYEITAPKSTPITAPVKATYSIGSKIIQAVRVTIPKGHKYLARLSILSRGRVIVPPPGSGTDYLRGDGNPIELPLMISLEGPPYEITLLAYNDDDTYAHTFYVEVR